MNSILSLFLSLFSLISIAQVNKNIAVKLCKHSFSNLRYIVETEKKLVEHGYLKQEHADNIAAEIITNPRDTRNALVMVNSAGHTKDVVRSIVISLSHDAGSYDDIIASEFVYNQVTNVETETVLTIDKIEVEKIKNVRMSWTKGQEFDGEVYKFEASLRSQSNKDRYVLSIPFMRVRSGNLTLLAGSGINENYMFDIQEKTAIEEMSDLGLEGKVMPVTIPIDKPMDIDLITALEAKRFDGFNLDLLNIRSTEQADEINNELINRIGMTPTLTLNGQVIASYDTRGDYTSFSTPFGSRALSDKAVKLLMNEDAFSNNKSEREKASEEEAAEALNLEYSNYQRFDEINYFIGINVDENGNFYIEDTHRLFIEFNNAEILVEEQ